MPVPGEVGATAFGPDPCGGLPAVCGGGSPAATVTFADMSQAVEETLSCCCDAGAAALSIPVVAEGTSLDVAFVDDGAETDEASDETDAADEA